MTNKKILIIKMGYSETLDHETSKVVSLGDVIRCTVILEPLKEKYPDSHITWLISDKAVPLIDRNKYIDRLLIWDEFVPYVLMREKYDIVINLEKIDGVCALTDMIEAWEKIGFRFNSEIGEFDTYMQSIIAKEYIKGKVGSAGSRRIWQKIIINMIGAEWKGQEYSLGYVPKSKVKYDIGLNYNVGDKWPTKAMPARKWDALESSLIKKGYAVSRQKGMDDLYGYMEWINSCRVIITSDSLGLHLALALKKKVIALFGPTDLKEIYFYGRGVALTPKTPYNCLPCYLQKCKQKRFCLDYIDISSIVRHVDKFVKK